MSDYRLVAFLAGPVVWAASFLTRYLLAPPIGSRAPLYVVTAVSFALVATAALTSMVAIRRARAAGHLTDGALFMARSGVWLNAFFLLLIVAESIPACILEPGD
jgi:hypothetical protein